MAESATEAHPLGGPWEVVVNGHVLIDGLPTRQDARDIAASWNRDQRTTAFRARRSDA